MKRITALILCLVFTFCMSSCGKKEEKMQEPSIDIEYYASLGQIPESKTKLTDPIDELKTSASAAYDSGESESYSFNEGNLTAEISTGDFSYYYMKEKINNGISCIISYDTTYGFEPGTVVIQIQDDLKKFGGTLYDPTADEVFFLPSAENVSILKYTFEKRVVKFIFEDNALCAVMLYDSALWTV